MDRDEERQYDAFVESLIPRKSVNNMQEITTVIEKRVVSATSLEESKKVDERQLVLAEELDSGSHKNVVVALPRITSNDIVDVPEPDEEEIEKMMLNPDEQALKARLWTTLNHKWIKDQRKKKQERKAE